MANWFDEVYISRRDWLIFHYAQLSISSQELTLFLLLDLFKEKRIPSSYENLADYLRISQVEVDQMITSLTKRKLLVIHPTKKGVSFDISPVFSLELSNRDHTSSEAGDLLTLVEETFGKPLSATEMAKLSDLLKEYDSKDIVEALRTSDAYQKYSLAYVETVLRNGNTKR